METNDYTNTGSGFCPKCHKPYFYVGDILPGTSPVCICGQIVDIPKGMVGWICPVCGAGLSPYTTICPCKAPKWEITC